MNQRMMRLGQYIVNILPVTRFSSAGFLKRPFETPSNSVGVSSSVPERSGPLGSHFSRTRDNRGRTTGEIDTNGQQQIAYNYSVNYDGNGNVTGYNDSSAGSWSRSIRMMRLGKKYKQNKMQTVARYVAFPTLLLLWLPCEIFGQAAPQAAQSLTLSTVSVNAGDTLTANLVLGTPVSCPSLTLVQLVDDADTSKDIELRGDTSPGSASVHLTAQIPRDRKSGTYHLRGATLYPCSGFENATQFEVPPVTVTVQGVPNTNVYPKSGEVGFTATQKQFFDTKIQEIDALDQQLTTRIENDAADLPELRQFLIKLVKVAQEELKKTESQYREQILKSPEKPLPVFLADFREQYAVLLVQLAAPIPGMGSSSQTALDQDHARAKLVYVQQLKKRATSPPANFKGTVPASVTATQAKFNDEKSAFEFIKDTGGDRFLANVVSRPPGAHVSYKKLLDNDYTDLSSDTDVMSVSFALATYTFKFSKDGCKGEQTRQINPYSELHFTAQGVEPLRIGAEFPRCHR
jgi:hypothetical protein